MPITRTPMVDDDGSGTTGTIFNNAWKTELYNQIDALTDPAFGAWIVVPFLAANFSGGGSMIWTVTAGQVQHNRYLVMGKTVVWSLYIYGAALSGTAASTLLLKPPFGTVKAPGFVNPLAWLGDTTSGHTGFVVMGSPTCTISKGTSANFALNASTTIVAFTVLYEVV